MHDRADVFVTGGSGFIGGRLVRAAGGRRAPGAGAGALATPRPTAVERLGAEPVRGDLGDPASIAAGAAGCEARLPPRRPPRPVGHARGVRRRQRHRDRERARRLPRGRSEPLRPLRDRGGADRRRAVALRRRDRAAAPRLEGALLADQGARRAGGPRRQRATGSRPSSCARASSGARATRRCCRRSSTAVAGGTLRLDRRRRSPHVDAPTSTTWSRACCSPAERGRGGEAYFVTDGEPVVFREFVSELLETQGVEPPTRSVPARAGGAVAARLRRRCGGCCAWAASRR